MPLSVTRPFSQRSSETPISTTLDSVMAISHALEDVILEHLPDAELAVGFQRISAFLPHASRYAALATAGRRIWVCGVFDRMVPPISGISFVQLQPEWPVADEIFLVANSPSFASAMLATEIRSNLTGGARSFDTLFTSDPRLVNAVCRTLAIEFDVPVSVPQNHSAETQQQLMKRFNELVLHYQKLSTPPRPGFGTGLLTPRTRYVGESLA